jgi:enamine deaminase RidA (YjgF/YER057c/UK114 family)
VIGERLNSLRAKLSERQSSTVGSFIPVVITGNNLAFVSGQIPIEPRSNPVQVKYKGKVGRDISFNQSINIFLESDRTSKLA